MKLDNRVNDESTPEEIMNAAIKLGNLPDEEFDKAFVGNEGLWKEFVHLLFEADRKSS